MEKFINLLYYNKTTKCYVEFELPFKINNLDIFNHYILTNRLENIYSIYSAILDAVVEFGVSKPFPKNLAKSMNSDDLDLLLYSGQYIEYKKGFASFIYILIPQNIKYKLNLLLNKEVMFFINAIGINEILTKEDNTPISYETLGEQFLSSKFIN